MSRLLHLLNRLKAEARTEMLTDSQRIAAAAIANQWRLPERVNLIGPAGSGKTFLGWVLARTHGAAHVSAPQAIAEGIHPDRHLIIDNVAGGERELRTLLAQLQLHQIRSALIISNQANKLGFPVVELTLPSNEDIHVVYHNLSLFEYYALRPLAQGNLWEIIYSTLIVSHT